MIPVLDAFHVIFWLKRSINAHSLNATSIYFPEKYATAYICTQLHITTGECLLVDLLMKENLLLCQQPYSAAAGACPLMGCSLGHCVPTKEPLVLVT
jgi:hypothetical protein